MKYTYFVAYVYVAEERCGAEERYTKHGVKGYKAAKLAGNGWVTVETNMIANTFEGVTNLNSEVIASHTSTHPKNPLMSLSITNFQLLSSQE